MSFLEEVGEKAIKTSPAYQLKLLGQNMTEANNNVQKIYKKIEPVMKPLMYFPCEMCKKYTENTCNFMPGTLCEMSKSNTQKICGMTHRVENYTVQNSQKMQTFIKKNEKKFKSGVESVSAGVQNLEGITELQKQYRAQKKNKVSSNNENNVNKYKSSPYNENSKSSITNQMGGYNVYAYITNPITGRKVSIFGKKGQQVFRKFLKNLNSDF